MPLLILEIILGLLISFMVICAPITLRKRSFEIEHGYFKHIYVGKFSILFGGSKKDPINKLGVIKPFLIMSIVSYVIVILLWVCNILIFAIIHDEIIKKETFVILNLICGAVAIIFDFILFGVMVILSKQRAKKMDKMELKSLFSDKERNVDENIKEK